MQVYMCDEPTDADFIAVGKAMFDAVASFRDAEIHDGLSRDECVDSFIECNLRQKKKIDDLSVELDLWRSGKKTLNESGNRD